MKKSLFALAFLSLSIFLTSCAMAPFSEPHTARVLGEGRNEWALTGGTPNFGGFSYHRGFNERNDLGLNLEYQRFSFMLGLSGKYLLTRDLEDENPLSLIYGAGFSGNSSYIYLGPIKSYRVTPWYELSLNARLNAFRWDFDDSGDSEDSTDYINDLVSEALTQANGTYTYVSLDISNSIWFSDNFGLTLSVSGLGFLTNAHGLAAKAGLKAHFNY